MMKIICIYVLFFTFAAKSVLPPNHTVRVYCIYVSKGTPALKPLTSLPSKKLKDKDNPQEFKNALAYFKEGAQTFQIDKGSFQKLMEECKTFIGEEGKVVDLKGSDASYSELRAYFYPLEPLDDTGSIKSLLENTVKQIAAKTTPSVGRLSLLTEIQKYPEQLGKDIKRFSEIYIGGKPITKSVLIKNTPEQAYYLIANQLERYVDQQSLPIDNRYIKGRLGQFWTPEILYVLSQNFGAPPIKKVHFDNQELGTKYVMEGGTQTTTASFKILSPNILEVYIKTTGKWRDLITPSSPSPEMITETKINFDLKSGEVNYNYSYKFGDKQKSWRERTFP